jgi:hypothetical protein
VEFAGGYSVISLGLVGVVLLIKERQWATAQHGKAIPSLYIY